MSGVHGKPAAYTLFIEVPGDSISVAFFSGTTEVQAGVTSCELTPNGELIFRKSGTVSGFTAQGEWKSVGLTPRAKSAASGA